jgi:hypothetical protein
MFCYGILFILFVTHTHVCMCFTVIETCDLILKIYLIHVFRSEKLSSSRTIQGLVSDLDSNLVSELAAGGNGGIKTITSLSEEIAFWDRKSSAGNVCFFFIIYHDFILFVGLNFKCLF